MCRLGIPDTEYAATIKMPSTEFARICKYVSCLALNKKWQKRVLELKAQVA